jgi:signal transduction histidine kinase
MQRCHAGWGEICIRSSVREICENLPQDLPCSHGGRGAENAGCTGFSSHRRFSTIRPGRYVEVEVEDTGAGISRDLLDRYFDPFVINQKGGKGYGTWAVCRKFHRGSPQGQYSGGK